VGMVLKSQSFHKRPNTPGIECRVTK
jgi:hypothetical protein